MLVLLEGKRHVKVKKTTNTITIVKCKYYNVVELTSITYKSFRRSPLVGLTIHKKLQCINSMMAFVKIMVQKNIKMSSVHHFTTYESTKKGNTENKIPRYATIEFLYQ